MTAKARSPTSGKKTTYVQYSKRLAAFITIFWCLFRVTVLALLWFSPSLLDGIEKVVKGADEVMMFNVACYCGNSVAEKGIVGYFGKSSSADESEEDPSNG